MCRTYSSWFRWGVFVLAFGGIYWGNFQFVLTSSLAPNLVAFSLLLDLVIWVPLLCHILLVRKKLANRMMTSGLVSLGLFCCLQWTPEASFLYQVKLNYWLILLTLAVGALFWLSLRFAFSWRRTRHLTGEQRVKALAQQTVGMGGVASLVQAEWLAIYYGLFAWRKVTQPDNRESFSYHQKSGSPAMLIFLSLFQLPSLCFTHVIFHSISPGLALVLTIGHIYTLFFGLSQAMAIKHRPILVRDGKIQVRCGLLFDFELPISEIAKVEEVSGIALMEKQEGRLEINMLGHSNLQLVLKNDYKVPLMAGVTKQANRIVLGLDDLTSFTLALKTQGLSI